MGLTYANIELVNGADVVLECRHIIEKDAVTDALGYASGNWRIHDGH